ncbi:MAG: hypothetical protein KW802_04560 [Candidatus Doudnabacteria bacterium]|nr:hypothetical protein [Candidatus Doudnabacteria bacterium]
MNGLKYLVLLGVVVQLYGVFSYIKDTLRGKTKPNKVTWFLWSIAPLIASAAALSSGVRWAVIPVFMSGFGPLLVFIGSFFNKNAYWKLGTLDYICGFFSLLALFLWWFTKEPAIAIIFAILSDGIAAVPTIIKAWSHPETETAAPYATGMFNALTGFAAISVWNFSQYAFPIYLLLANGSLLLAIYKKKIFRV